MERGWLGLCGNGVRGAAEATLERGSSHACSSKMVSGLWPWLIDHCTSDERIYGAPWLPQKTLFPLPDGEESLFSAGPRVSCAESYAPVGGAVAVADCDFPP